VRRHRVIPLGSRKRKRCKALETRGFGAFDALHIACAESTGTDVFLTRDDSLWLELRPTHIGETARMAFFPRRSSITSANNGK
jgi:predicted nucleic acid-binding protein